MSSLSILVGVVPLCLFLYSFIQYKRSQRRIKDKKILIIGGSSGLGQAFLTILANQGNHVTGTSRDKDYVLYKNKVGFCRFIRLDVRDESSFEDESNYDYIFYCTGISMPGNWDTRNIDDYILCYDTNYIGMLKILKHYQQVNNKQFDFIMVGSTLALFPVPGYSTYSPTKSAILSFFYSTYQELLSKRIRLHLFNPSNMNTRGFQRENLIKDPFNIQLESIFDVYSPTDCAEYFLKNMFYRKVVTMDTFTYLCQIRYECEKPLDYVLFPLAVIVVAVSQIITRVAYKYYIHKSR